MFTGIVEAYSVLRRVEPRGTGIRVWIAAPGAWEGAIGIGSSIAVSGACLTVAAASGADLAFDLSAETLAKTWFAELAPGKPGKDGDPGRKVNLERGLRLGDRLDGHLVSGHVDGLGRIVAIEDTRDGGRRIRIEVDAPLERYLIEKGSVTIDGISLTVVEPRGSRFDVAVIPLTLEKTSLGEARVGQRVNVEADMLGKWIDRLLAERP